MKRRSIIPVLTVAIVSAFAICNTTGSPALQRVIALSPISLVNAASQASKLGDLSRFRSIAVDTSKRVDANNLASARERIKDLETSWDEAEPSLKPRSAADWHKLDKAIDNALEALRDKSPDQSRCKKALEELIALMDQLSQNA